jgi:hypothetical protein
MNLKHEPLDDEEGRKASHATTIECENARDMFQGSLHGFDKKGA